eukprot:jgi/Picsp_1/1394/NSC_04873-R1_mtn19-like protein
MRLIPGVLAVVVLSEAARLVLGRTIDIKWTLGEKYAPIEATIGDTLNFAYRAGIHDVWSLPEDSCNFEAGSRLDSAGSSSYTLQLNKSGTYYYGCSTVGHCDAGQILLVNVRGSETSTVDQIDVEQEDPAKDEGGFCSPPVLMNESSEIYQVSCRSKGLALSPGDNIYPNIVLPSPYPKNGVVLLETVSAEIVDQTGRPVPLSDVYLHHTFGDYRFIPGEGSEVRGSPMRNVLDPPYGMLVNGSEFQDDIAREVNLHVINTIGVPKEEIKKCIECWCEETDVFVGSIGCCKKCNSTSTDGPRQYFLSYNVTYRSASDEDMDAIIPVTHIAYDVNGGVEYSIEADGKGSEDVVERTFAADNFCPQDGEFSIVRCWAHQHIGGKCITVSDPTTGKVICKSCPVYGTEEGVPGNEKGYLVAMTEDRLTEPYPLQPGQKIRVEAVYDSSEDYGGVMSILVVGFADFNAKSECNIDFGGFIQPKQGIVDIDADELLESLDSRVAAIPESCTEITALMQDLVVPCMPFGLATILGSSLGESDKGQCCKLFNEDDNIINRIAQAGLSEIDNAACACPLGELLRYGIETGTLGGLFSIPDICQGRDPQSGLVDAVYIALNSLFGPRCPELMSALEAMSSEDDSQEENGVAPEQQQATDDASIDDTDAKSDLEPTTSSQNASETTSSVSSSSPVHNLSSATFLLVLLSLLL